MHPIPMTVHRRMRLFPLLSLLLVVLLGSAAGAQEGEASEQVRGRFEVTLLPRDAAVHDEDLIHTKVNLFP